MAHGIELDIALASEWQSLQQMSLSLSTYGIKCGRIDPPPLLRKDTLLNILQHSAIACYGKLNRVGYITTLNNTMSDGGGVFTAAPPICYFMSQLQLFGNVIV